MHPGTMGGGEQRVRRVIERLVRDGTAVARIDGTLHRLFPVAASAAEGEALREWVVREGATQTIEIGLGYGISALHTTNPHRAPDRQTRERRKEEIENKLVELRRENDKARGEDLVDGDLIDVADPPEPGW